MFFIVLSAFSATGFSRIFAAIISRIVLEKGVPFYITDDGCAGGITCFDGRNGNVIWTIYTKDEVYELTCLNEDFDSDGTLDCIASGRYGTLLAFNPKSGIFHWQFQSANRSDRLCEFWKKLKNSLHLKIESFLLCKACPIHQRTHSHHKDFLLYNAISPSLMFAADIIWSMPDGVNEKWNAFAPAFIQDISGDGIRDIVLVNGGDTQYTPEVIIGTYIYIHTYIFIFDSCN